MIDLMITDEIAAIMDEYRGLTRTQAGLLLILDDDAISLRGNFQNAYGEFHFSLTSLLRIQRFS